MSVSHEDAPVPGGTPDLAPGNRRLLVLVAIPAIERTDGHWLLPTKLVTGMRAYAERWNGPVVLGLQPGHQPSAELDNAYWAPDALPFQVMAFSFRELAERGHPVLENTLAMGMLHHELHGLARRCREVGSLFVVGTELTLRTQIQIARSTHGLGPTLLKNLIWLLKNHRLALRDIVEAHGLQCNGTPIFDAYASRNPNTLLYFDSRTTADMLASAQDIDTRFQRLVKRGRPHLFFSGRLHPIKGAHHLVPMAEQLRQLGLDFELSIAGDGPLRSDIEAQIRAAGLQDKVRCLGTLRFADELMPLLRQDIDLFICPHLQGDPSCTYLETLSGAVPIVGYDNEAWQGLYLRSGAGVLCQRHDPDSLASVVLPLAQDVTALRKLAQKAVDFAREHLFEIEFNRRITHLQQVASQGKH
jgi:glycosyltransferase involved in cell wall biosynthesis